MTKTQGWIVIALLAILAINFIVIDILVVNMLTGFAEPVNDCPITDPNWPVC